MIVFDAQDAVVGRLCTQVAKKALAGEEVAVVNAEKAFLSGDPKGVYSEYQARRGIQQKANPEESAKWPRRPDYLFKRILKGMLPKKKARGAQALKRVKAYIGVPKELEAAKKEKYGVKSVSAKKITLQELCERLGWGTR